jgi:ABC-2 type transport system ATP-binding protein/lipopolysaccharide transport system ATP-binding protein
MVHMKLDNVCVDFPIYGGTSRSLKNSLVHVGTGGRLATDAANRKVVNALRHVTLDIREGERIGLIGSNGAGKTTLLRVMAGIYEPTKGVCSSFGKIVPLFGGSLGMNPELTGLENIYQRGRVLRLSSRQIKAQIDDIVAFTELEHFIHLPMRTYSAGMRVRLAFAVTTAIDADILLLDEGLGAGDQSFREKARARLQNFISRAGILILATHSASLMRRFCNQGLWLDHGHTKMLGDIEHVLKRCSEDTNPKSPEQIAAHKKARREAKRLKAEGGAGAGKGRADRAENKKPARTG